MCSRLKQIVLKRVRSMYVFITHDLSGHTANVEASSSQGEASTHMVKFHVLGCLKKTLLLLGH